MRQQFNLWQRLASTAGVAVVVGMGAMTMPKPAAAQTVPSGTRFSCQFENGEYQVMYSPASQPGQLYPWARPTTLGGGWTADRRCAEIARRLESYRPDGLTELKTGTLNGYNVVCATTQQVPDCRLVLTVPPGQDPIIVRDRVFENLTVADSGQRTEGVTTFQGRDGRLIEQIGDALNLRLPRSRRSSPASASGINLRPFLDPADGGTGDRLRSAVPARSNSGSYRLNPDLFR
ncbi:COP23 domain-containing protein [Thermoleptolyngbya sp. M55_K2018_002]|uniref:COP23 domain-containing protein n=1 Tax=Thermoleptolyngbya sp. M55_K2018_002 TaxID=2747808 RepID=UPI0019FAA481|nr:COP23 domain-containing protein [Thermoleptolyngbya sp. M55_K2018_002]HIK42688.1 hypothetical protein [Thermoleptolyngbya sp. M55_K2018_002]